MLIKDKKPYGVQVFSGVAHGFALRCNLEVPYEGGYFYPDNIDLANLSSILQRTKLEEHC
jgi:hypothetical protein